jgi:hypothetical protein
VCAPPAASQKGTKARGGAGPLEALRGGQPESDGDAMDLSIAESKSSTGSQPAGASVADLATEKALDGIRLKGGAGQGMEGCWSEQVTELLEQVMAQQV